METVREFMTGLKPFDLTKAEKLMLLNNRPTVEAVFVSMVEECEDRFPEEVRADDLMQY